VKALIIDDEPDICFLLSMILKQKNFDTHFVGKLSDAGIALKKESPSIIFLDNHLPDGLGIDFIEHIKLNNPSSKIVMITAHDTPTDRRKAMQNGADLFLGKPFTKEAISLAVSKLCIQE
jgi:two-component system, OmpR family, response regulator